MVLLESDSEKQLITLLLFLRTFHWQRYNVIGIVSCSLSAADVDGRERCSWMLLALITTTTFSRDEMCTQLVDIVPRKQNMIVLEPQKKFVLT